jgi:hypothetical protein
MRTFRCLAIWGLGLWGLGWAGALQAQEADLPDLSRFRDRVTFQNPYRNVEDAPEAPPPVSDTTLRVPTVTWQMSAPLQRAWNYYVNNTDTVVQGFRVQIFLGEPDEASRVKFEFMENYERVSVYSLFESPYWKIRVGDFETRREAERFLKKLKGKFPGAFIVPETIVLRYEEQ